MKKKAIKALVFLIIIGSIYCLYSKYNNYQMLKGIDVSTPIVFAAEFEDGNKGTFKYNIKTGEYEKISDYIFQELSYSDDYEKIIGVIWEDRFQGIAELDMKDYTFKPVISLDELNKCVKELGLTEINYNYPGVTQLRMPRYYKDGYTFFWGYYSTVICYIREEDGKWNIRILNNTDSTGHNYFLKKEQETLFLETEKPFVENKTETGIIIKKTIDKDDEIVLVDGTDENAFIDMTDDMSKIVYYNEPKIYMYNLETDKNDYISSQYLIWQHMLYLKLSSDGRYLFYTVGDIPFFWSDYYRMNFFIVDTKTGNKVNLNRWEEGDRFYGIDW